MEAIIRVPKRAKLLSGSTSNGEPTFPWKLHLVLEDSERLGFSDIISWQGDRAFKVHNQKKFELFIMKAYFKQTQYRSFQRQLNLYGFRRVKMGHVPGSYTHTFLVRGRTDMCCYMLRTKVKKKGTRGKKIKTTPVTRESNTPTKFSAKNLLKTNFDHTSLNVVPFDDSNKIGLKIVDPDTQNNSSTSRPAPSLSSCNCSCSCHIDCDNSSTKGGKLFAQSQENQKQQTQSQQLKSLCQEQQQMIEHLKQQIGQGIPHSGFSNIFPCCHTNDVDLDLETIFDDDDENYDNSSFSGVMNGSLLMPLPAIASGV